jgi:flavin reductase (DIM6/NTAB) family NADH-FMN oxidoreductase RutF
MPYNEVEKSLMTLSPAHPSTANEIGEFCEFDFESMPRAEKYKLLVSVIMPRPIAWVVSRHASGGLNAAPFSFFNLVCPDPALVAISFSATTDRQEKDSLANIRAHGEFVVNLVPEELAEQMNVTATDAPAGVDETQLAGLDLAPCSVVQVPRISRSPVALECKLAQTLDLGSSTLCLGRIVYGHIRTSAFKDVASLHIDPAQLRLIGRMHGGGGYCTTKDLFYMQRKKWPLNPDAAKS